MARYIYDELHKNVSEGKRQIYWQWRREWRAVDKSRSLPKQVNTYHCELFMMLTIYLNSWGVSINRLMYDQHAVYEHNLSQGIATLFSL